SFHILGAPRSRGYDSRRDAREAELYPPPPLSDSQQQRPMERHSKATFKIARSDQRVFYAVQDAAIS
ncbi:hypothetical protein KIN20_030395, partial [Parelaphostrongylus tenuis]